MLESCAISWMFSFCTEAIVGRNWPSWTPVPEAEYFPSTEAILGCNWPSWNPALEADYFPLYRRLSTGRIWPCWSPVPEAEFFPPLYRKQRRERMTFTRAQLDVLKSLFQKLIFPFFTENRDEKGWPLPLRSWKCCCPIPEAEYFPSVHKSFWGAA